MTFSNGENVYIALLFSRIFTFFFVAYDDFSYLHTTFSPPVAHGNIKAANVLLDEDLMPRLSDCGIAVLKLLTSNSVKAKASTWLISSNFY